MTGLRLTARGRRALAAAQTLAVVVLVTAATCAPTLDHLWR